MAARLGRALHRTAKAVAGVGGAAGGLGAAGLYYEAWLSKEDCAVSVPLRCRYAGAAAFGGPVNPSVVAAAAEEDAAERSCVVIGGGVVGVTTAYFLARRGFQVTLLERRKGPGEEASAVNAGWLRLGPAEPLSQLATIGSAIADEFGDFGRGHLRAFFSGDWLLSGFREYWRDLRGTAEEPQQSPVGSGAGNGLGTRDATYFVDWSALLSDHLRFAVCFAAGGLGEALLAVGSATAARREAEARRDALHALSVRSVELTQQVIREEDLDCTLRFHGQVCVLLDDPAGKPRYMPVDEGTEVWSRERALEELSYLRESTVEGRIHHALRRAEDGIGDCAAFTHQLAQVCKDRYGVKVRYGADVRDLQLDDTGGSGQLVARAQCSDGRRFSASFFVLANGAAAGLLGRSILDKHCATPRPVYLPICGVRGYSLTLPIACVPAAHLAALARWPCVVWEPSKVVLSAFPASGSAAPPANSPGRAQECPLPAAPSALRFTGIAEVAAADSRELNPACEEALRSKAAAVLPFLAPALAEARVSAGLRPQSADDLPIISGTRHPNLFVNAGHGGYGWRLACGSAETLACLVDPRSAFPHVDARSFSLRRFSGGKLWRARLEQMAFPELFSTVGPEELLQGTRAPRA